MFEHCVEIKLTLTSLDRDTVQLGGMFNFGEESYKLPPLPPRWPKLAALFGDDDRYTVNFGITCGELQLKLTNLRSPIDKRDMLVPLRIDLEIERTVTTKGAQGNETGIEGELSISPRLKGKLLRKRDDTTERSEKRRIQALTIHSPPGPPDSPIWQFKVHTGDILFGAHKEECIATLSVLQPGKQYSVVGTFCSRPDYIFITEASGSSLISISDKKWAAVEGRVRKYLQEHMPNVLAKAMAPESTDNVPQ